MNIKDAQARAWANKVDEDSNTTNIWLEFNLLYGEVGDAHAAWRMAPGKLGEKLADVVIFALGLAEMCEIDLDVEVEAKLTKKVTDDGQDSENKSCGCGFHGDHAGCDNDCECAS